MPAQPKPPIPSYWIIRGPQDVTSSTFVTTITEAAAEHLGVVCSFAFAWLLPLLMYLQTISERHKFKIRTIGIP